MTYLKFISSLTLIFLAIAAQAGSEGRGGGDVCEDRIKLIRDDVKSWIEKGGAVNLTLPSGLSTDQYSQQMLSEISKSKISCVSQGDSGYPIQISGTPKVCRFDKSLTSSRITCDFKKFQSMNESDQYVLIHHELAGLAKIETPNNDDSVYSVSNQISGYLVDQIVKRLAVNAGVAPAPSDRIVITDKNCIAYFDGDMPTEAWHLSILLEKGYQPVDSSSSDPRRKKPNALSIHLGWDGRGFNAIVSRYNSDIDTSINLFISRQKRFEDDAMDLLPNCRVSGK